MIGAFDALWDVVHEDLNTPDWMANLGITLFAIPLVVLGPFGGSLAGRPSGCAADGPSMAARAATTVSRPFCLASYNARSARWTRDSKSLSRHSCNSATPKLAVTSTTSPSKTN